MMIVKLIFDVECNHHYGTISSTLKLNRVNFAIEASAFRTELVSYHLWDYHVKLSANRARNHDFTSNFRFPNFDSLFRSTSAEVARLKSEGVKRHVGCAHLNHHGILNSKSIHLPLETSSFLPSRPINITFRCTYKLRTPLHARIMHECRAFDTRSDTWKRC